MSESPLISILITSFNYGHMIATALQSACAQDYPNLEILVLDNASNDDTYAAVKPFLRDRRVRYIQSDMNIGMTPNHNRGLREARGAFVNFLAADDKMLPGYLSRAYSYLQANPEIDVVYSAVVAMDEAGEICQHLEVDGQIQAPYAGKRQELAALLAHSCYMSFPTLLTRRTLYERYGELDDNVKSIDYEIVLRWAAHHVRFAYMPEAMIAARVHDNEQSSFSNCIATGDWLCDFVYLLERYSGARYREHLTGYEQTIAHALGKRIIQAQAAGFTVDKALSVRIAAAFERLRRAFESNRAKERPATLCFAIESNGAVESLCESLRSLYTLDEFPSEILVFEQPGPSLAPLVRHEHLAREARFIRAVRRHSPGEALRASSMLARGNVIAWIRAGQNIDQQFVRTARAIFAEESKPHTSIPTGKDAAGNIFVIPRNTLDEQRYDAAALDRMMAETAP